MSEKSLILAHFVLVNTSGRVDSLDSVMGDVLELGTFFVSSYKKLIQSYKKTD